MAKHSHHHSTAVEDYIKQIYKLQSRGERATTKAIAERLDLGRGTVSGMLRQLESRGLLILEPYYGVKLTEQGRELALRMIRRHRLLELFLVKSLDLKWDQVHRDAERLEHAVSDELIDVIDEYLGRPEFDPHGDPIPSAAGSLKVPPTVKLEKIKPGQTAKVARVPDSDSQFLKHLTKIGIALGVPIKVIDVDPFGTMQVKITRKTHHLAAEATSLIEVEKVE